MIDREADNVSGSIVTLGGEDFYEIVNYDEMPPFLMSLVSAGDQWCYLSSTGGLTAGRATAENCLFPYETVDKLHDNYRSAGPTTAIRLMGDGRADNVWQPFQDSAARQAGVSRRLLKHLVGDEVRFVETNEALGLRFSYGWRASGEFGFVRTATLENTGNEPVVAGVVDGLQNLFPGGAPLTTQQRASCLIDGYKQNEIDAATGLGVFGLTAQILDRAEAAECLRATTVWSCGLDGENAVSFLSKQGLRAFYRGQKPEPETLSKGQRGNFFRYGELRLDPGQSVTWYVVSDVGRDHGHVAKMRAMLSEGGDLAGRLEASVARDREDLVRNIASADGLQAGGSPIASAHHFANVLFNNMRGGVFASNYLVETGDFLDFVGAMNRPAASSAKSFLRGLPEEIDHGELMSKIAAEKDKDLKRLGMEYLPLTFGRRHGDPSRPWNAFEIRTHNEDGSRVYHYQGNWRDIFQNWEALCASFPEFLPSIIAKFLNASTIDGHNPYRITSRGIDWEAPDPEDPWSNIGYWGDHQIVYLSKLIELFRRHYPEKLQALFNEQSFCYANVPYRIKPFEEVVVNSSETIDFDTFTAGEIDRRVERIGGDGRLLPGEGDRVYYAGLVEKLLVPVLAKLSNFVVDGGIWLNTQRPEWNDANNALVGSGLSMVTVCYLHRHLALLIDLLKESKQQRHSLSVEVEQWFRRVQGILEEKRSLLGQPTISDEERWKILQATGEAFSDYRLKVYDDGFSGKHTVGSTELLEFFRVGMEYCAHAIRANRRPDGLYHAYNILELEEAGRASVGHLYEMLEGQVAVLSSGALDAGQAAELIDALFASKMYRDDQSSFMLYPDRELPRFCEKNLLPADAAESSPLVREMLERDEGSIVYRDASGDLRFHHAVQKRADLAEKLDELSGDPNWADAVQQGRRGVEDLFEGVFRHKTYTGRSGTMYSYEGLGCIYWHMVSKLLLAVQENVVSAVANQASKTIVESLIDGYFLVRGGLSADKSPQQYGAVPTDPYSHSPKHSGAQQPGMTGQVKEEVLTRRGELGVFVNNGSLRFQPTLLRRREFTQEPGEFEYFDVNGQKQSIALPEGSLAFTLCQVPVVCELTDGPMRFEAVLDGTEQTASDASELGAELSAEVFGRTGKVTRLNLSVPENSVKRA